MSFEVGDKVRITATRYKGSTGTVVVKDYKDLSDGLGFYRYVVSLGGIESCKFYGSELEPVALEVRPYSRYALVEFSVSLGWGIVHLENDGQGWTSRVVCNGLEHDDAIRMVDLLNSEMNRGA